MNIFEQIFNFKKNENRYIITILGVKIKIKNLSLKKINNNYEKVLDRIKSHNKINVVFLVTENQKWHYQDLYDYFEKDGNFNPLVLVSLLKNVHYGIDKTRYNLEENYNFFKSRGMNVEYCYKDGNYISLENFKPDIIFYEHQWDLPEFYNPDVVSRFALTFYCPYGISMFNFKNDYIKGFHSCLFKCFIDSDYNIQRFENYHKGNSKNCIATGSPKIDRYLDNECNDLKMYWKEPNKVKIIYAPHHTVGPNSILKMATFKETGLFMLDFAKRNPNITWIFKPHPQLKYALIANNIMTEHEVERYYNEWKSIGNVYLQGDYIDIFRTSDLMITDCCSFLAEYLPSGKPLIRLLSKKSIPLNLLGQEIVKGYYEVSNNDEFETIFKQIVIEKNDYKYKTRIDKQKLIIDFKQKSSKKIFEKIKEILNIN